MSQANVEIVRRVYEGWSVGDFSEGDLFDPEIEFEMVDWPEPVRSTGLEAMQRYWMATLAAWEDFRAAAGDIIDAGEKVVVLTHISGRGRGSGIEVSADTATVWTVREGRIVALGLYWDVDRALEAAGVPS